MKLEPIFAALEGRVGGTRRVRQWRLYVTEGRRLSLGVKDGDLGGPHAPLTSVQSGGVRYLVVWDDGRVSRGYFERAQLEDEPERALGEALANAYDDPDAAQVLGPGPLPEVDLYDPETARAAAGDLTLLATRLDAIRRHLARDSIRTWSGSFSFGEGSYRLVTSAGLDLEGAGTSTGWHVTLNGEIGDGHSSRRPETDPEFDARLERLLTTSALLDQQAGPMDDGIRRVILHPRVVDSYMLDTLLSNLDGAAVSNGESHFRREQFGSSETALRPDISLRVDPLQPLRSGSYRVTREGVAATRCTYIDAGRLVVPIADLKYAKRLGIGPTPVPYSMDTLSFEGASRITEEDAMSVADGGALILNVLGVHTQDATSGDFSLSVPQALQIDGEAYVGKMKATISGNLFEVLRDPATEFVRFSGEHTPGLVIRCRLDPR